MAYRMTKLSEFTVNNVKSIQTVFNSNRADVFIESGSDLQKIAYENGNLELKYKEQNFYAKSLQLLVPTWNVQRSKDKTLIFVHREEGLDVYEDEGSKTSKSTSKADGAISKQGLAVDTITDVLPVVFYGKFDDDQFLAIARSRLKLMAIQIVKFDDPSKVDAKNGTDLIERGTVFGAVGVDGYLKHFIHRTSDNLHLYKIETNSGKFEKIKSFRLDPQHEPTMERAFITDRNLYYFNDVGLNIFVFDHTTTSGTICDDFSKSKGWKQENMNSLSPVSSSRFFFTGSLGIRYFDIEDQKCTVKLIASFIWQTPVKYMNIVNVFQKDGNLKMIGIFEDKLQYVEWKVSNPATKRRRSLVEPVAINGAKKLENIFSPIVDYFSKLFSRVQDTTSSENTSVGFLKDHQANSDENIYLISQTFNLPMDFRGIRRQKTNLLTFEGVNQAKTYDAKTTLISTDFINGWILLAMIAPAIVSHVKNLLKYLFGVFCRK